MLKAFRYELYPTTEQRKSFDLNILASSIYFNFILGFYKTAFDAHKEYSYLTLKKDDDKQKYLDIIKLLGDKVDREGKLIKHNEWARTLLNDTEYHKTIFFKRDGTPKGNWVDIAEACATYAIYFYKNKEENSEFKNPLTLVERGALQMSREAVKNAVSKFFTTRTATKPMKGFPKFKSRKNPSNSFQFSPNFGIKFTFDERKMQYQSRKWDIGAIKLGKGRVPPESSVYRTITISRTPANRYYVSVLVDYPETIPVKKPANESNIIGIDVGIGDRYYTASDGEIIENPKHLRKYLNRLIHKQRLLSNKAKKDDKGYVLPLNKQSSNYKKDKLAIDKLHEQISNYRNTFIHTITSKLVNEPSIDGVAVETLSVKDMMISDDNKLNNAQKKAINKSYADASIFKFYMYLGYKSDWKGKHFIKVNKYFASSQLCSVCGYKNSDVKDLSIRVWICPKCNTKHDRDGNASKNIEVEGIKILRQIT